MATAQRCIEMVSLKHTFQSAVADSADTALVQPSHWNAEHDLICATSVILGRITAGTGDVEELTPSQVNTLIGNTGWGAYIHTGAAQALTANNKVTLTNNAGTILHNEKPSDIPAFYSGGLITGRAGDSIAVGIELTFTPSDGTASSLYLAIDIGGAVGEIYPDDFAILKGQDVPHRISYNVTAYTLDTWQANGGAVKVLADGPGAVTAMRYVIHRLHKA